MSKSPESRPPLKQGDAIRMDNEDDAEGVIMEVTDEVSEEVVGLAGGVRLFMQVWRLTPVKTDRSRREGK